MFRSKIDRKLAAIGLAAPLVAVVALVASPKAAGTPWLPMILMALVAVLIVWVVLSTYYEFRGDMLVAHAGPLSWRVPLKEIASVRESNSMRSGPALSMDRLEITYGDGRVLLISPRDKQGFLSALRHRAPTVSCAIGSP